MLCQLSAKIQVQANISNWSWSVVPLASMAWNRHTTVVWACLSQPELQLLGDSDRSMYSRTLPWWQGWVFTCSNLADYRWSSHHPHNPLFGDTNSSSMDFHDQGDEQFAHPKTWDASYETCVAWMETLGRWLDLVSPFALTSWPLTYHYKVVCIVDLLFCASKSM